MARYKWAYYGKDRLDSVGINADGTLHNPNGYPDEIVRAAVLAADGRRRERRSEGAKKAAETRRIRRQKRVYAAADLLVRTGNLGPRTNCYICGRGLGDRQSIEHGIGSECWQDVLTVIEKRKQIA